MINLHAITRASANIDLITDWAGISSLNFRNSHPCILPFWSFVLLIFVGMKSQKLHSLISEVVMFFLRKIAKYLHLTSLTIISLSNIVSLISFAVDSVFKEGKSDYTSIDATNGFE